MIASRFFVYRISFPPMFMCSHQIVNHHTEGTLLLLSPTLLLSLHMFISVIQKEGYKLIERTGSDPTSFSEGKRRERVPLTTRKRLFLGIIGTAWRKDVQLGDCGEEESWVRLSGNVGWIQSSEYCRKPYVQK